jgi:propanediol dehydratase large subunit
MSITKQTKDLFFRFLRGKKVVPSGLAELHHYFRMYEPIRFKYEKQEDGSVVAISENFRFGSIITRADTPIELDEKISDAILTAFEVPSSYAKDAAVHRLEEKDYAFA